MIPDRSMVTDVVIDLTQHVDNPVPLKRVRTHIYEKTGNGRFRWLNIDEIHPGKNSLQQWFSWLDDLSDKEKGFHIQ